MLYIKYDDIFESFLGYIKDNKLLSVDVSPWTFGKSWLKSAYSKPHVRRLFSSFTDDGTSGIEFLLNTSVSDGEDCDFVSDVLVTGMVIAWLSPQVNDKSNIELFFGGKEQKFYSQANHIEQLRGLLSDARILQRALIRDRGYIYNSYLEG